MDEIKYNENFTVEIIGDIMHITIKPDTFVELHMVQEFIAVQREILQGEPILVLLDVSKAFGITKEAREFTASNNVDGLQIAMAIVISSLPMRLLANFFIKFDKPPAPTKMFNSHKDAINWLKSF